MSDAYRGFVAGLPVLGEKFYSSVKVRQGKKETSWAEILGKENASNLTSKGLLDHGKAQGEKKSESTLAKGRKRWKETM